MSAVCSCSEGDEPEPGADPKLSYDAACQRDTLRLKSTGTWSVESYPEWINLTHKADRGDIVLPIYVQQNDDGVDRSGEILINLGTGRKISVAVAQGAPADNGISYLDLPRTFGLGWGYDLRIDYADIDGVRGQILAVEELRPVYGNDFVEYENDTYTAIDFEKAESTEVLQRNMSVKLTGEVDLKVASAKLSSEFSKQTTEQKNRLYVWCRDVRWVKSAYFANQIDLYDPDMIARCSTSAFRQAVRNLSPAEIVGKFGTHFISSANLGGKLDYYFSVSSDITTEVEKIVTTLNVKLLFFKKSQTWVDEKVWTDVKTSFQGSFKVRGGGTIGDQLNNQFKQYADKGQPLTDETLFNKWYGCFENASTARESDLTMVGFEIIPIWDIIGALDSAKGEAVKNYITTSYLK